MRKKNNKWIKTYEAIELIMQRTGKSRQQAETELRNMLRSGKLPARAYDLETGDPLGPIPPHVFGPQKQ